MEDLVTKIRGLIEDTRRPVAWKAKLVSLLTAALAKLCVTLYM